MTPAIATDTSETEALHESVEDQNIRSVGLGEFNPDEDQIRDDKHLLLYVFSVDGLEGHFEYGTSERMYNGKVRGDYARELFRKRLSEYKTTGSLYSRFTLEGLYVVPRHYNGTRWTDTKVGKEFFEGLLGLPKSDELEGRENVMNATFEELEDTLIEQFGGSQKISIYNDHGYHTYQEQVAEKIYNVVEQRVKNGNTDSIDVLAYLAARFGKTRTFLKTVKDLWERFGYGVFAISPYWLSVHNGFEEAIAKYREFDDFVFIDFRPDSDEENPEERLEWAYKRDDKFPVVALSLVKGDDGKSDIQKLTWVPKDERIILIDEADYGAHTDESSGLIEYIEESEDGRSNWGPKSGDSVRISMLTTGSGKEKMTKYEKDWDLMESVPYLELFRQKKNGDPTLQHIVEPHFLSWNAGKTLADELKRQFPQEQIPSLYQLAKKAEQNEHIWRMLLRLVFSDDPYGDGRAASAMNIVDEAADTIGNFNKSKDGLGVMAKMPSVKKEDLIAIADAAEEALDEWAVMPLCGRVYDKYFNVVYEGTTNAEAEDKVKQFMANEYDPDEHNRGVLILTMGMGFRSFTVPDISVVANFADGGSASTIVQAASRAFSPGVIKRLSEGGEENVKKKREAIFADYGFDQSKKQDAITKFMARNLFAERDSDRSNGESLGETLRRIYPSANVIKYMGEFKGNFGRLESSDLLSRITGTGEFNDRAAHNTNLALVLKSDSIREIFSGAKSTDISEHIDGQLNVGAGSSGTGSGNSGGGNGGGSSGDDIAEKAALLRGMGFLLPAYTSGEDTIFEALDVISENEDLREEWIDLCGVTPEDYKKLLRPTGENGEIVLPVDEISSAYQTRDDTFEKALRGVLGANKLFEIPVDMAEEMASKPSENLLMNDRGVAVLDAAGPNIIEALRNVGAENLVVFTRLHLSKRRIQNELPNARVEVVDVRENESVKEAYERTINEMPMKFDVALGNPPYQEEDEGNGSSATPIYNEFVRLAEEIAKETCLVIPGRWFAGGKGLTDFRRWMLDRNDIVSIQHWENHNNPFETVDLPGGVCVIYANEEANEQNPTFNGEGLNIGKYDILVPETKAYPIIDSVLENADQFLDDIFLGRKLSGFETNDDRFGEKEEDHYIKCYVSQSKGFEKWADPDDTNHAGGGFWKVITPEANGENPNFGNTFVGRPDETYTDSYIGFKVNSAREAISLRTYMKTNFAEYMLALRKNTQHISSKTVKWIPVPPLDRIWTDEELKEEGLFGLSDEQWKRFTQND